MKRILPVLLSILMFFSSINSAYAFENNSNSPIASDHSREAEDLATLLFEEDWTIYDETGKDITAEFYTVANDLYRQHAYESIMEAFVGMTAHAIKREIVPSEDRSISWIYEEEVGYEYVDELNHNFPNHNYFVYRV